MLGIVCVVLKKGRHLILPSRVFTQFLHGGSGESSEITDSEACSGKLQQSSTFLCRSSPRPRTSWRKWIKHFEMYKIASGLTDKPYNERFRVPLYSVGTCADGILATPRVNESKAPYDETKTALECVSTRRNAIVDRALLNRPVKAPGYRSICTRFIPSSG